MTKICNDSISKITFYDIVNDFGKKRIVGYVALSVFILTSILVSFWATNREHINYNYLLCFIVGYTVISTICSFVIIHISSQSVKMQWTLASHFILAFIITLAIWACDSIFYYFCLNINNFSFYRTLKAHFLVSFLMGFIIGIQYYLWIKNKYHDDKPQVKEEQSEQQITRSLVEDSEQKMITLSGNSPKNFLSLLPQNLLYIESTGNYVLIYYLLNKEVLQKKLRATLSKMEDTLKDYPFIVRCHHAFIVNLHHSKKLNCSKIWLNALEKEIPISKTYKADTQKQANYINHLSQI